MIATGGGKLDTVGFSAGGHAWNNVDPKAPIEKQVEALKKNVERLNDRLVQAQKEIDAELRKHSDALLREQQARAGSDDALYVRLETEQTGGLHISLMGSIWLFIGLPLSALSNEIARMEIAW